MSRVRRPLQRDVTVIENWGPMDSIPARPKDNPWAARHGLTGKLVFLYSGTMALKHDPEPLWRLAEAFRGRDDCREAFGSAGALSYEAGVSIGRLSAYGSRTPAAVVTLLEQAAGS